MPKILLAAGGIMLAMLFAYLLLRYVRHTMTSEYAAKLSTVERAAVFGFVCLALLVLFLSILARASAAQFGASYGWTAWAIPAEYPAFAIALAAIAASGAIAAVRATREGKLGGSR